MKRFRLAHRAKIDIAGIRRYIASDKPEAADRQIERFFKLFHLLAKQPLMGQRCPEFGDENLRMFTTGNYVVFYRPIESGVEIARVVSGFRDLESLF
jgi:toxin ParE1/3/4